jgi:hypothetical protein
MKKIIILLIGLFLINMVYAETILLNETCDGTSLNSSIWQSTGTISLNNGICRMVSTGASPWTFMAVRNPFNASTNNVLMILNFSATQDSAGNYYTMVSMDRTETLKERYISTERTVNSGDTRNETNDIFAYLNTSQEARAEYVVLKLKWNSTSFAGQQISNLSKFVSPKSKNYSINLTVSAVGLTSAKTNISSFIVCNDGNNDWLCDSTQANISLNPLNYFNASNITRNSSSENLNFNITFEDNQYLYAFKINVSINGTTYYNFTNESLNGLKNYTFINTTNIHNWLNGDYLVDIYATDAAGDINTWARQQYKFTLFRGDIDNCSQYTDIALNISYYDITSNALLTIDEVGYDFNFSFYSDLTKQLTGYHTGITSHKFCTSWHVPSNFIYTMNGQLITIKKSGYVTTSYNIPSANPLYLNFSNITYLKIYMLPTNETTTTKFTWLTDTYLSVTGTMYVHICNIDGTKTLYQSVPIINGVAYANLQLISQSYSYSVLYDGVLYEDLEGYSKCHVESADTVNYFILVNPSTVSETLGMYSIVCNLTKTGNDTVKMSWSVNPESDATIIGCIYAYRYGPIAYNLSYTSCVNNTFSIERTIPDNSFNYEVKGRLYQSGYSVPCSQVVTFQHDNYARTWGLSGLFSVILLILSFALFYAGDDTKMLVGAICGIILSWIIGILAFEWPIISALCAFVLVIGLVGRSASRR